MRPLTKTKFGFPARTPAKPKVRQEIFRPTLGMHSGDVPQDLPPGFTPAAQNFVTERGYITPRSGLSRFGGYSFGRPVLGGAEVYDTEGNLSAVAVSARTIAFYHPSANSWSELSYVPGSFLSEMQASFSSATTGLPSEVASFVSSSGAIDGRYIFHYGLSVDTGSTVTVHLYTSPDGVSWTTEESSVYTASASSITREIVRSGLSGVGERFGIAFEEESGSTSSLSAFGVSWMEKHLWAGEDLPSGLSTDYWSIANVYDLQSDAYIAVLSNGTNRMKFFPVKSDTTVYSDFTFSESLASTKAARAVFAINDRLCFFNTVDSSGTKYPTRVLWSARGNVRSFEIADGAGFEDLMGMKGEGLAAVRYADVVVLFTREEVWIARPTLDDYAFRFDRISDSLGCPWPRSAVATPIGVIFLAHDKEFYVVSGNGIAPLGPWAPGEPSRVQGYLQEQMIEGERCWATYNQSARRYEFYFSTNESIEGFPTRALYYNIDDRSWMPQVFNHELSFGFDFKDPGALVTWDSLRNVTWEEIKKGWDSVAAAADERWVTVFGSGGTAYRLRSDQTTDDGVGIDARWRSHGLNQADQMRQEHLTEVWMDYRATSDGSAVLYTSGDLGASFDSGTGINMRATNANAFVPVWRTSQAPMFEIRVTDGSRPRIGRFQVTLTDAGRMSGGR